MSDWVNECMLGCLCIVMSVFIPFDSGLFALFLHSLYRIRAHTRMHKPQHTHSHTQAHAQWCYSFYSGVEVFSQYSIGSCTYVYFVMTLALASYDWIFVFFSCAIYTRVAHSHTIKYSWNVCSFLFPSSTFCILPFFVRTACYYGFKPVTIHNFFFIWLRWVSLFTCAETIDYRNERMREKATNMLNNRKKPPLMRVLTMNYIISMIVIIFDFAMNGKRSRWLFD